MLLFIISGCASTGQELDPKVYYVRDLSMKVDKEISHGLGVIPKKDFYKIKLRSPGQMSLFVFETCHRERQFLDEGKRLTLRYTPVAGIEDQPNCMILKFSSFDRKKGKHAEGILLVEQERFKLSAQVKCNGTTKDFGGTSVCHSKEGLSQEIVFSREVTLKETKCKLGTTHKTATSFKFKMPNRECIFTFRDANQNIHLMFTSGYEQILIRN